MHTGIDISRIATTMRTGTEQYTCEVLAAIARLDTTNTYTLYCQRLPATLPPLGANMRVRCIPLPRLWTHVRLSVEVLRHAPDVLFIPAHVLPLGAPLVRRMRTVVTIHDLGYSGIPTRIPRRNDFTCASQRSGAHALPAISLRSQRRHATILCVWQRYRPPE
jgi:hypothetical protein